MSFEASRRSSLVHAEILGPADPAETARVTVILRRRTPLPPAGSVVLTREELREVHGADPVEFEQVRGHLEQAGLRVVLADPGSRRIQVEGTVGRLAEVFGATLHRAGTRAGSREPEHFRYRTGALTVPEAIAPATVAVLGLDTRPQARAHFRIRPRRSAETVSYSPLQVGAAYRFPDGYDGTGRTVAMIELGGGYDQAGLEQYFQGLGISTPTVTAIPVDGGANAPTGSPDGPDGEVQLDVEVAGSLAPGAAYAVYFAPNTDQGFVDAISEAVHATPAPIVVSISWGASEDSWSSQSRTALDAAIADAAVLGVTVCAAAGDNGSSDDPNSTSGVHCDFPASSPHALACGGTKLVGDVSTFKITSEVVWNELAGKAGAGGGGVSDVFGLPPWQQSAGVGDIPGTTTTGRGVPDVAGNADPVTGYQVIVDGRQQAIGGTSAVAPLWAGLIARLAQATGKRFGLLQPLIYAGVTPGTPAPGFNDIVDGNNGAYQAGPGWDACTGLGSPNGQALLSRLSS